ncbi:MAG TPA: hypothetical protein VHY80_08950, partial [Stellaceae bacterium]|nr:hypothetical protein [Stellaceae bacterium]
ESRYVSDPNLSRRSDDRHVFPEHRRAGRAGQIRMGRGIEAARSQGFVPAAIDPHQYADLSMIEEAAQRFTKGRA